MVIRGHSNFLLLYSYTYIADVTTPSPTLPTPTPTPTSTVECYYDSEVRIVEQGYGYDVNGNYYVQGSVEMCRNGTYAPVCYDGWDITDASIACKYHGYYPPYYGELSHLSDYCCMTTPNLYNYQYLL